MKNIMYEESIKEDVRVPKDKVKAKMIKRKVWTKLSNGLYAMRTVKVGNSARKGGIPHPTQTTSSEFKVGNRRKINKEIIHTGRDDLDLEMESAGTKTKRIKLAESFCITS